SLDPPEGSARMIGVSLRSLVSVATVMLAASLHLGCGGGGGGGGGSKTPPGVVVASVAPSSGPASGGTIVTITGSGFVAGQTVAFFAGAPGTDLVVLDDATLTVRTPAGPDGFAVEVAVDVNGFRGS